jgi:hypothetical protein
MDRRRFIRSSLSAAIAASIPGSHALAQSLLHTPTSVPSDIDALTGDGAEVTLKQAAVQELSDSLKGKLISLVIECSVRQISLIGGPTDGGGGRTERRNVCTGKQSSPGCEVRRTQRRRQVELRQGYAD